MPPVKSIKPRPMLPEVEAMIKERHEAEQRGQFDAIGRLLSLETARGVIQFPAQDGESTGPGLGVTSRSREDGVGTVHSEVLLILGTWEGLPALRKNSDRPCTKCLHDCDGCDGSGKKICQANGCGGRGWIPGPWQDCPGDGCRKETGSFNPECKTCCGSGQIPERLKCPMCAGSGRMVCPRCKGKGKFATGYKNGKLPRMLVGAKRPPKCPACDGTSWQGKYETQDMETFTNARLCSTTSKRSQDWLVLGPIFSLSFAAMPSHRICVFDVTHDEAGDLMVLVVPASKQQKPQKAYLVGGKLREREMVAQPA